LSPSLYLLVMDLDDCPRLGCRGLDHTRGHSVIPTSHSYLGQVCTLSAEGDTAFTQMGAGRYVNGMSPNIKVGTWHFRSHT
jgi:hypothetical protein